MQVATTLVLLVAANSAFNGFPRLLYFMARDGYVPRLFLRMGDRLAFSNGILVLAVPAAVIYAAFGGQTAPLIPLFAIGVFLAFTLAQSGMVAHWWRHRERGWRAALATNLLGAVLSALVVLIAAITKLTQGAWVVVVLVPLIVLACRRVHAHYERAREALTPRPDDRGADVDRFAWRRPGSRRRSPSAWPRRRTTRPRCTASPSSRSRCSTSPRCTRSPTPSRSASRCSRCT